MVCILNQVPDMYITSPLDFWAEIFVSFPTLFFTKILEPWIDINIQIVDQLLKIDLCNKHIQKLYKCIMESEYLKNIFSYVGFTRL